MPSAPQPLAPTAAILALADLPVGQQARVCALRLGDAEKAWLAAVGVPVGETVRVLRRGIFGGPLHLRLGSGAEFAIDRDCARSIDVTLDSTDSPTVLPTVLAVPA